MPIRPPDRIDDESPDGPVMLAILGNGGHGGSPLTGPEKRLLDDWAGGRLAGDADARQAAASLARRNALAAEWLLERRLVDLAADCPAPPTLAVTPRTALPPAPLPGRRPWILPPWRWPVLAGGLVLASALAVVSVPMLQEAWRGDAPIQLALVTIGDRGALFEPSDIRMRGGERTPVPATERRFRDLEIPAETLHRLFPPVGQPSSSRMRDLEALLGIDPYREPARILVDATLRARADASPPGASLAVRLYDLDDPRAAPLRAAVGAALPADRKVFLLTARP